MNRFTPRDYFDQIYEYAVALIKKGKAYVCDLTPDQTDEYRRNAKESPFRNRSIEENLDLFTRMKNGEFPDGTRTLRAKIDMASPNIWMRDPLLYRIRHAEHHHTGGKWCIYPMYDFAHCLSDYIEGITHCICTLEFEVHRPLYDWILENLDLPRPLPHQYEFARLSLGYTVMSKRKLMQLVNEKLVTGWDDPRMPTISGIRRRGVTAGSPARLRLQHRHHQIQRPHRRGRAGIRHPRRPEQTRPAPARRAAAHQGRHHQLSRRQNRGTRRRQQSRGPERRQAQNSVQPRTVHRAGRFHGSAAAEIFPAETRRRSAVEIRLHHQVRRSGQGRRRQDCRAALHRRPRQQDRRRRRRTRKVKGTIHWVSAAHAVDAEVRLYDRLFTEAEPDAKDGRDFKSVLNPHSLEVVTAKCEPSLKDAKPELRYQFERLAYFALDKDSAPGKLVFNRTITLKDPGRRKRRKGNEK